MIIIGVGNEFRHDDGVGPAVIDALRGRVPEDVTLAVCDGEPARLIDLWAGAPLAVVVDAVQADRPEPGRVHELDSPGDARSRASSHALGLGAAVELGRALERMPRRLVVYAVEGADFGLGPGLSPPVAAAVAGVADRITAFARSQARPVQ